RPRSRRLRSGALRCRWCQPCRWSAYHVLHDEDLGGSVLEEGPNRAAAGPGRAPPQPAYPVDDHPRRDLRTALRGARRWRGASLRNGHPRGRGTRVSGGLPRSRPRRKLPGGEPAMTLAWILALALAWAALVGELSVPSLIVDAARGCIKLTVAQPPPFSLLRKTRFAIDLVLFTYWHIGVQA